MDHSNGDQVFKDIKSNKREIKVYEYTLMSKI